MKGPITKTAVRLNRNFMNFPLARDMRAQVDWRRGSRTGRWVAYLPGEDRDGHRIRLILPKNAEDTEKHCPSTFDINLLFQLFAEAQNTEKATRIEFESATSLLNRMGLEERDRNRARLIDSLVYWNALSIRWPRWYQDKDRVELSLSPPVKDVHRPGNRLVIELNPAWLPYACPDKYYERVPLPLPPAAATQNLALLLQTRPVRCDFPELSESALDALFDKVGPVIENMDRWWVARKIGLVHKTRNAVLNRAIVDVEGWFLDNGGRLKCMSERNGRSGKVAFRIKSPQVPRAPKPRAAKSRRSADVPPPARRKLADAGGLHGYLAMVEAAVAKRGPSLREKPRKWGHDSG